MICAAFMVSCSSRPAANEVTVDTRMRQLLFPKGEYVLTGGDAAISIALGNKKSLWLWGDSFLGKSTGDNTRETTMPTVFGNVFTILEGDSVRTIIGGTREHPGPVVASEKIDGKYAVYWPHHGFLKDNILHLFASQVVFGGTGGMWDFWGNGVIYCRLSYPDFKLIDLQNMESYPANKVTYGYGVYEERGHYYFYGNTKGNLHAGRARLVNNKLQDWEFFDGTGWTADPSKTHPLAGDDVAVSEQFSIFKYKDKYILVTQARFLGNEIFTYIADSPTGPWYNKKKVFSAVEPVEDKNLMSYNAMAHPQYKEMKDMLLISYCLNMHKPTLKASDYHPRFIWVPYQMILK